MRSGWNREGGAGRTAKRARRRLLLAVLLAWAAGPALADTIVLKDGTILEGTIVRESDRYVRIETKGGTKSIERTKIDRITKESDLGSAVAAISGGAGFGDLTEMGQALKNAEAIYALKRFDEIRARVEPLMGKGTPLDEMRIRWLLIETAEREGKWDEATGLLKKTLEDGREPDKIRAKAHLDIFEQNPGYTLRRIGERRSKEFLTNEQWRKGKDPGALQDGELMRAALLEYVDQILRDEKLSLYQFQRSLDVAVTFKAIDDRIDAGAFNAAKTLPYYEQMRKVENSLYKVNAIWPGYASCYDLDVIRIEADHLRLVLERLFEALMPLYPDITKFPSDDAGRLTAEGRVQWQKACDEFLRRCRPAIEINQYIVERMKRYPTELRKGIKLFEDVLERIEQMRQAAERSRTA